MYLVQSNSIQPARGRLHLISNHGVLSVSHQSSGLNVGFCPVADIVGEFKNQTQYCVSTQMVPSSEIEFANNIDYYGNPSKRQLTGGGEILSCVLPAGKVSSNNDNSDTWMAWYVSTG